MAPVTVVCTVLWSTSSGDLSTTSCPKQLWTASNSLPRESQRCIGGNSSLFWWWIIYPLHHCRCDLDNFLCCFIHFNLQCLLATLCSWLGHDFSNGQVYKWLCRFHTKCETNGRHVSVRTGILQGLSELCKEAISCRRAHIHSIVLLEIMNEH